MKKFDYGSVVMIGDGATDMQVIDTSGTASQTPRSTGGSRSFLLLHYEKRCFLFELSC